LKNEKANSKILKAKVLLSGEPSMPDGWFLICFSSIACTSKTATPVAGLMRGRILAEPAIFLA
jgi:hypothetical protein